MPHARKGKIARLPFAIREQINQRLLDNQNYPAIIKFVNAECDLRGSAMITDGNLSEWRAGGFADWLQDRDRIERTKHLSEYCLRMANAGGNSMNLPAAIAGGQLMEVLEGFDPAILKETLAEKPETWLGILEMISKLQRSKADEKIAAQNDVKLAQNAEKLALEKAKFQRTTCELFLKWYATKAAAEIAANKALAPDVKIEQLRALMFGEVESATDQHG
jgi:hypothetical protein